MRMANLRHMVLAAVAVSFCFFVATVAQTASSITTDSQGTIAVEVTSPPTIEDTTTDAESTSTTDAESTSTSAAPSTEAPSMTTITTTLLPIGTLLADRGCGGGNFTCATNSQCIPIDKVCDNELDCEDASDEGGNCQNAILRMALEIERTFYSYGCVNVISDCAAQYLSPLFTASMGGRVPTIDNLCKGYNQVLRCAVYESCPLSDKDKVRVAELLVESIRNTLSSQMCEIVDFPTMPPPTTRSPPTTQFPSTTRSPPTTRFPSFSCVTSCARLRNGDYQSCLGCSVYATCSNGFLFDGRACPSGLVWDDNVKRCEVFSGTCGNL